MSNVKTCSDERPCINCFSDQGECLGPLTKEIPKVTDRLRSHCFDNDFESVLAQDAINETESLRQQLAECQATNGMLRGLVDQFLVENDTTEFGCACHPGEGYVCGTCRTFDRQLPLRQAIAIPNDATALNELIAEAENRTAEACAKVYLETYDLTDIADAVRSGAWREYK